jgi:hypothetical protein
MTEFDFLTDISRRDFIQRALETDGGIVINDAFMTDEEDLIEFGLGESAKFDAGKGGLIAVDRPVIDTGMEFMVVVLLDPDPKGLIEIIEIEAVLDTGQEALPDGAEEPFYFPPGRAVIGFGVDEGDTSQGATFGEQIGGKAGPVIHVKSFGDSVAYEGLFEDRGEGTDGLGGIEGLADDHPGMIIQNDTKDGLNRTIHITDLRAVHEVADPEVIDVIDFEGFADIGALGKGKPALGFNDTQ